MVTKEEYEEYFGQSAPSNFSRLEFISLNTLKAIVTKPVPKETCPCYEDFKKAILEQINFYEFNSDLITDSSSGSYTLGSYSEGGTGTNETSNSMSRISPVAYEILLNCGLLQSQLGGCCLW